MVLFDYFSASLSEPDANHVTLLSDRVFSRRKLYATAVSAISDRYNGII